MITTKVDVDVIATKGRGNISDLR